jgi:hypothetical protein
MNFAPAGNSWRKTTGPGAPQPTFKKIPNLIIVKSSPATNTLIEAAI